MSETSNSPKPVLLTVLKIAKSSFAAHHHRNSPKKFTQHQLFACLVLNDFFMTDYRGLVEHLADCDPLADSIELICIPHYTMFQKAARRLLVNRGARRNGSCSDATPDSSERGGDRFHWTKGDECKCVFR